MNRRTNDQILGAIAGDFINDKTNISSRIMTVARREHRAMATMRVSQYAFLSLITALLILIVSVPEVASAMRRWAGFLPGVGMVDQSEPIRVLQEAVSSERGGITVTVDQLYALPDRTVIQYQVRGIPESAFPKNLPGSDRQGFQNPCVDPIFLRLPGGKTLTYTGYNALSGTQNVTQYEQQFTVEPIPANVDTVTLVMPCIDGTEQDAIPGAWELPLRLVQAEDQAQLQPVYLLSTVTPALPGNVEKPVVTPQPGEDSEQHSQDGVWLTVDHVAPLPNGDLLLNGMVRWDGTTPYSQVSPDLYELVDAQGRRVPFYMVSPDPSKMPAPGDRFQPFAFQIKGPVQAGVPLTLKIPQMRANAYYQKVGFPLDTGAAPSINQQWTLNQDVQAGKYTVLIRSVIRLADGYEFSLQSDPEIGCVDVYIQGANHVRGECGQGMTKIQYDRTVPTGALWIGIANMDIALPGNWQVTWSPPEMEQPVK